MLGLTLAWLLAAGLVLLGLAAALWPRPTSYLYGVPQEDAEGAAWVRAAGFRDLGLALALGLLLADGSRHAASLVALATGLVAAADLVSVSRFGRGAVSLAVHASGIAMGVTSAALLR